MAGTLGIAILKTAVDLVGLNKGLKKGEGQTKLFGKNASKGMSLAIKGGLAAAGAAAAKFAAESVKSFTAFETKIKEVFTLLPEASVGELKRLETGIKDLGVEMGRLPEETVPALYQSISAGVPSDNVFEFLKTANELARAGVVDLETAVSGLTSVTNAYGADVISAAEASDIMFTAVKLGTTTVGELSRSLFNVLPTAAALGVKFEDVAAAMATMTVQGTPTKVAATQLRQLLVELSKAGSAAANTFERAAGKSFKDFIAEGNNVSDALVIMQQVADDSNVSMSDLFGSVEAGSSALQLSGSNTETFNDNLIEVNDAMGSVTEASAIMGDTAEVASGKAAAAYENLKITVGEGLTPAVKEANETLANGLNNLTNGVKAIDAYSDQIRRNKEETRRNRDEVIRGVSAYEGYKDAVKGTDLQFVQLSRSQFAEVKATQASEDSAEAAANAHRLLAAAAQARAVEAKRVLDVTRLEAEATADLALLMRTLTNDIDGNVDASQEASRQRRQDMGELQQLARIDGEARGEDIANNNRRQRAFERGQTQHRVWLGQQAEIQQVAAAARQAQERAFTSVAHASLLAGDAGRDAVGGLLEMASAAGITELQFAQLAGAAGFTAEEIKRSMIDAAVAIEQARLVDLMVAGEITPDEAVATLLSYEERLEALGGDAEDVAVSMQNMGAASTEAAKSFRDNNIAMAEAQGVATTTATELGILSAILDTMTVAAEAVDEPIGIAARTLATMELKARNAAREVGVVAQSMRDIDGTTANATINVTVTGAGATGGAAGLDGVNLAQSGGNFSANQPLIVGEAGPELIVPRRPTTVLPNEFFNRAGNGNAVEVNIDARGATDDMFAKIEGAVNEAFTTKGIRTDIVRRTR